MSISAGKKKSFTLKGRLLNKGGTLLSGFKILVHDKDLFRDDYLGTAVSDQEGRWTIKFDSASFSNMFLGINFDKRPDLYFKVYDNDQVVLDTSGNPMRNVEGFEHRIDLVINVKKNQTSVPASNEWELMVKMADGSSKKLIELGKGDKILNGEGKESLISFLQKISKPGQMIYSINGGSPFLSEEEAIMTQRGWCSLNPRLTRSIHPHLRISHLKVGDAVWKTDEQGKQHLEAIRSIEKQARAAYNKYYCINVRQGDPSIWMNGFCVLINTPEINIHRTASNIHQKMSVSEQIAFKKKLDEMRPLLEKTFGKPVVNAAMNLLKDPQKAAASAEYNDKFGNPVHPYFELKDVTVPGMIIVPIKGGDPLPDDFKNLAVVNGHLVVNGAVVQLSFTQGDNLYWTRTRSNGSEESGTIKFSPSRHHGVGVLQTGNSKIQFSVFSEIDYAVQMDDNTPWYGFAMQFELDAQGNRVAVGSLKDQGGNILPDNEVTVALSTVTNQQNVQFLTANAEWNPTWVAWNKAKWIAASITWATDYKTFTGTVYEYDSSQPQNRGIAHAISGTATNWDDILGYEQQLTKLQSKPENQRTFSELANSTVPAQPGFQRAMALTDDTPLTVEALYSLAPPDMTQVHENCFATIKNMMLYVLPDDQLAWFDETRPSVGPGEQLTQDLANTAQTNSDINTFLTNQFALGYLTQAFSQSTDPDIQNLLGDQTTKDKLGYFWQGNGTNCFPNLKGYNLASAYVMDQTYASMTPGLDAYMQDTASNWGQQLYLYCLNPATLNGLAAQNMMDSGSNLTNNLAMKLHALSPDATVITGDNKTVSYATSIYEAIVNVCLQNVSQNFTSGTQEDMVEYLTGFLQTYFTDLINGTGPWADDIRSAATQDLNDYMQQNGIANVDALIVGLSDSIAGFATIMVQSKTDPLTRRLDTFSKNYPRISSGLGGFFTFAAFGLCTASLCQAILNWKDLTPVQKAQVIVNTAYQVVVVFNKFASWRAAKNLTDPTIDTSNKVDDALALDGSYSSDSDFTSSGDSIASSLDETSSLLDSPFLASSGRAAGAVINEAEGTEQLVSNWQKIANIADVAAKGLGLLVMAGACVATGFQIADDFKTDQPWDIKVLDILEEVSNGVCFLISAGATIAGIAGVEVASFIPIVGIVVAVVGIIIALVLTFIHRKPPPTPEEIFVQQHCVPFVNGLDSPPQSWLDNRQNAQNYLNTSPSS
ncbi:MAG TPA: hypothetical protein PLR06_06070 [Cyclobacteriaceae bacterium]|nr:hypothetical protein [Cyclobacteriaceae bacterium]